MNQQAPPYEELLALSAERDVSLAEKFRAMLRCARRYLELEMGIISQIEGQRYEIFIGDGLRGDVSEGTVLELDGTYCERVVATEELCHTHVASEDITWSLHPAYTNFALESYVGVPIMVGGQVHGTLNFSSAAARRPFARRELEMVRLLAGWIGHAIEQDLMHARSQHGLVLARQQAEAARDAAERADRSKSAFLANVSHELRTPMNGILGMCQLLLESDLEGQHRGWVEVIDQSAEALLKIIEEVLDLSKIEADKIELHEETFDPRQLLEEVSLLLAGLAHDKNIELAWVMDVGVPRRLIGDATRLRQILINLAGNAIKFTEQGSVTLRTRLLETRDVCAVLCFEVEDTGPGIPRDALARIFEPFSQLDDSHTRRHGGTGLGLAISRQLVERMGGEIDVESELGEGSTFSFTIALEMNDSLDDTTSTPFVRAPSARLMLRSNAIEESVRALCNQLGINVLAEDSQKSPAILFVELEARGAARYLDALPRTPTAPRVVALVPMGSASAPHPRVDATLEKPVIHRSMLDVLRSLDDIRLGAKSSIVTVTREMHNLDPFEVGFERVFSGEYMGLGGDTEPISQGHVLVVEDNAINRQVLSEYLVRLGYTFDVAEDGAQALERCAEQAYDAILMDCQMPNVDGYEATRRLRASPGPCTSAPVIAITAHAMRGDEQLAFDAGMNDYLTKPVRREQLKEALERWVEPPHRKFMNTARLPAITPARRIETSEYDEPRTGALLPAGIHDTQEAAPYPGTLDEDAFAQLLRDCGDASFVRELVDDFIRESEERLLLLEASIEDLAHEDVARAAHTQKGASSIFGLVGVEAQCRRLEQAAHARRAMATLLLELSELRARLDAGRARLHEVLDEA